MQHSQSAFTDSVDSGGLYTAGICGEKEISLNSGSPSFLTITADVTNPTLNDFSIDYDQAAASEADIGITYTVAYTVQFKQYLWIVADHTASFNF